jgi:hypothetical protein
MPRRRRALLLLLENNGKRINNTAEIIIKGMLEAQSFNTRYIIIHNETEPSVPIGSMRESPL